MKSQKYAGFIFLSILLACTGAEASRSSSAFPHRRLSAVVDQRSRPRPKAQGKCVCVFDFDETLRVWEGKNGDTPAKDGGGIIQRCRDLGYEVAIASANCNTKKLRNVLPLVHKGIFTQEFFASNAFQHCEPWKTRELKKILNHFDTVPECAMFFDDQYHNLFIHARNVGLSWRLVKKDTGVTWDDFWGLLPEMLKRCNCL